MILKILNHLPLNKLLTKTLSESAFIPEGIENGASGRAYLSSEKRMNILSNKWTR
jgi:hypothetical protein